MEFNSLTNIYNGIIQAERPPSAISELNLYLQNNFTTLSTDLKQHQEHGLLYQNIKKLHPDLNTIVNKIEICAALLRSGRQIYEAPDSYQALASWIDLNRIPLAKTGLTYDALKSIAPYLHYIDCRGLELDNPESFISLLTNVTHLFIQSDKLTRLELLPRGLQTLECSGRQLKSIQCTTPAITTISVGEAPLLKEVRCYDCPSLTHLSLASAPKLELLMCTTNPAIVSLSLPEAPELRSLHCENCTALASLTVPDAPKLTQVYSYRCPALAAISIGNAPELHTLSFNDCTALAAFSLARAPKLQHFQPSDCPNLTTLPLCLGESLALTSFDITNTGIDPALRTAILNQCRQMRDAEASTVLPSRLAKWQALAKCGENLDISALSHEQKQILNEWLVRLERTEDFAHSQSLLANTVCAIILDVLKNREFQELFFSQADANNEHCQDRAAMSLNEIFTSWNILCATETLTVGMKLKVMTGVAKTLCLRNQLQKLLQKRDERESVEIFLYYESTLRNRLDLVTAIQNMRYSTIGQRDWINVDTLVQTVEANFFDELIELPLFERLLEEPWKMIRSEFSRKLEQLGECPKGDPEDAPVLNYQHRQGEIMQEWKQTKLQAAKKFYAQTKD